MTDQAWLPADVSVRAAAIVRRRRDSLVADLDLLLSTGLDDPPADDLRAGLVGATIDIFAIALCGEPGDTRVMTEVDRMQRAGLGASELFAAVQLAEGSILHELSIDADLGVTSDRWPAVTTIVRRASFGLVRTLYERAAAACDVRDPVTRLMSRAVFEIAVAKELQRAVRYHHPVSLVLLAVDNLARINERNGRGVGALVMERLGTVMDGYFREPDWVAGYAPDSIGVLLPETSAKDACVLAEGARETIEERLVFRDENERPVAVTVSASVVTMGWQDGSRADADGLDAARVLREAEAGVTRARGRGGNTVECVEVTRESLSVAEVAACLHCSPATVRRLIGAGTLPATGRGNQLHIDRVAVEAYAQRQSRARPKARRRRS